MNSQCTVVIVAGGSGTRAGGEIPKQFQPLLDLPLFLWSVCFFAGQETVGEMVLVAPAQYLDLAGRLLAEHGLAGRVIITPGGPRRQDSVLAGIEASSPASDVVAVHDAARPFPPENFAEAVAAAREAGGAIFAAPVTDSIKRVRGGVIRESVPREELWAAQTPQLGRRDLLMGALRHCAGQGIEVTDEASALERVSVPVAVLKSPRTNLKVTLPEDWIVAEAIARSRAGVRR